MYLVIIMDDMANANPLLNAKAELELLLRQKIEIERRVAAVQQSIGILEPVYGGNALVSMWDGLESLVGVDVGLTTRIREILRTNSPKYLSPLEVRTVLISSGFNTEGRSNFLSEIHNTLKRLKIRGEADEQTFPDGKRYRSLGSVERRRFMKPPLGVPQRAAQKRVKE